MCMGIVIWCARALRWRNTFEAERSDDEHLSWKPGRVAGPIRQAGEVGRAPHIRRALAIAKEYALQIVVGFFASEGFVAGFGLN